MEPRNKEVYPNDISSDDSFSLVPDPNHNPNQNPNWNTYPDPNPYSPDAVTYLKIKGREMNVVRWIVRFPSK